MTTLADPKPQSWLRQILPLLALGSICVGAIALLQVPQLRELQRQSEIPPVEEIRRSMEAERVRLGLLQKVPAFGYDNLLADWVFLNFLQYFGDEPLREKTDYTLSPDFFEVIIPRNPYFLDAYIFLSSSTGMYAGQPEQSIELMNLGLESLRPEIPGSFYVWRHKGIDELLFLGNAEAARQSFETAAEWAEQSNDPNAENAAYLSRQTAQFLASNPNSKFAQVAAWTMVLSNAPDDRTRRIAVDRIRILGGDVVPQDDGSFRVIAPSED